MLALAIIALGAALRVQRFAADRSLWLDEVMLALNMDRTPAQWTEGLEYHQAAPFGFLWVTRGAVGLADRLGLPVEYALRLLPLLASLGSLVLLLGVARKLLSGTAALCALAILALGEPSVRYAAEFKPYGVDAFATLAILACALTLREQRGPGGRHLRRFTLVGALACWFSFPSAFMLGACSAWLAGSAWRSQREQLRERLLAIGIIATSGLVCIWLTVLPSLGDEVLARYWKFAFAPFPPSSVADFSWYVRELLAMPRDALGLPLAGLGLLCTLLGTLIVGFRDRGYLALLVGPFVLAMMASWIDRYPWQGRLMLFASPLLAIFCGIGLDHLRDLLSVRHSRLAALIATVLLLLHPLIDGIRDALSPPPSQEMRQVMERLGDQLEQGDLVYLYYGSVPAWRFYAPRLGLQHIQLREGTGWQEGHVWGQSDDPERWVRFANDFDELDGKSRVWVVMSHIWRGAGVDDERLLRYLLDGRGTMKLAIEEHESMALLYDLGAATEHARMRSALNETRLLEPVRTANR